MYSGFNSNVRSDTSSTCEMGAVTDSIILKGPLGGVFGGNGDGPTNVG